MKRFEYWATYFNFYEMSGSVMVTHMKELNTLGEQGWEMCGMTSTNCIFQFYFKREIPTTRPTRKISRS